MAPDDIDLPVPLAPSVDVALGVVTGPLPVLEMGVGVVVADPAELVVAADGDAPESVVVEALSPVLAARPKVVLVGERGAVVLAAEAVVVVGGAVLGRRPQSIGRGPVQPKPTMQAVLQS